MALGSGVLPIWCIMMPYDKWEQKVITDDEMWEWITNPKNYVPREIQERWADKLGKVLKS